MDALFRFLEEKNSYLKEFHKINAEEMENLAQGRVHNLENFYYARELLLNAIARLDASIAREKLPPGEVDFSAAEKDKMKSLLRCKRTMILSILDQDLIIISLVEKLKHKPSDKQKIAA